MFPLSKNKEPLLSENFEDCAVFKLMGNRRENLMAVKPLLTDVLAPDNPLPNTTNQLLLSSVAFRLLLNRSYYGQWKVA